MGIYILTVDALREALRFEGHDFGRDIIPRMMGKRADIFVYDYEKENRSGASIGYNPEEDRRNGYTVSDNGIVVVPAAEETGQATAVL
jgi:hypothetical protein